MSDDEEDARRRKIAENMRKLLGDKAVIIVPPSKPETGNVLPFKPKKNPPAS